jgi:hypothetical protein
MQLVSQSEKHLQVSSKDFKKKHKFRQSHVTEYINSKGSVTFEETVKLLNCLKTDSYNNSKLLL